MVVPIAFLNSFLSFFGLYRAYRKRHMVVFIWLILSYYSITSIVSLGLPENMFFSESVRMTYVVNMLLCIIGFLVSDYIFNRRPKTPVDLHILSNGRLENIYRIIETIFWFSLIATFFELRMLDYNTYNTGSGGGWFQVIFQCTSCIIVRFMYKKQWLKIGIASIIVLAIVSFIGVRSLMYFVLMPIVLFILYDVIFNTESIRQILKITLPMAVFACVATYVVNMLRFSESKLPETELTTISLSVISDGSIVQQYIMSALHYIVGLLTPIINALNKLGLRIPDSDSYLLPSVPKLNAVVTQQVPDASLLENAAHMPATIYHDLWFCWGNYAIIASFFVYWYLLKIFSLYQRNALLFFCFAGVFGWHFYMLMRGSVDTCSSGVAYSVLLSVLLYFFIKTNIK